LKILAARPEDQGTYTVRATNPVGSDETTSKLTIKPVPSIDTKPSGQPEQVIPLEVKAPLPKKEDLKDMQPPKVIVPIENQQVTEGTPALLEATIIGKPTPSVRFHTKSKVHEFLVFFLLVYMVQRWCTIECI
jgi:hypothetical protein